MDKNEQLTERNKELNCLYEIDRISQNTNDKELFLKNLLRLVKDALQFVSYTHVEIVIDNCSYKTPMFEKSSNYISEEFFTGSDSLGNITIYYYTPELNVRPIFLEEEKRLLYSVASRISDFLCKNANKKKSKNNNDANSKDHSAIRNEIVNLIPGLICNKSLGIKAIYLIGSTKNRTAAQASDIDLIVYYDGKKESEQKIKHWFKNFNNMILAKFSDNHNPAIADIFDLHFITDEDIKEKTSYAVMIESKNNSAHLIT